MSVIVAELPRLLERKTESGMAQIDTAPFRHGHDRLSGQ
jgi:hypothetical protein